MVAVRFRSSLVAGVVATGVIWPKLIAHGHIQVALGKDFAGQRGGWLWNDVGQWSVKRHDYPCSRSDRSQ